MPNPGLFVGDISTPPWPVVSPLPKGSNRNPKPDDTLYGDGSPRAYVIPSSVSVSSLPIGQRKLFFESIWV